MENGGVDPAQAGGRGVRETGSRSARLLKLGAALVLLLPLSSAANLERVPLALPVALALVVALSVWRPASGLVVLSALVPVSGWLGRMAELHGFRMAEALVLAVLAGALLGLALGSRRGAAVGFGFFAWPAVLLLAAAAASAAVEWCLARVGLPATLSMVSDFVRSASTGYLFRTPAPSPGVVDAELLVEGVALLLLITVCSGRHPDLPRRLAIASLAGAAGAAVINLTFMVTEVVISPFDPWMDILAWYVSGVPRLSVHVADPNAAGSYFLMMTMTGLGLTFGGRRTFVYAGALATVMVGAALWLAGSRAAVAGALLVGGGAAAWWIRKRQPRLRRRTVLTGVALATVLVPIAVISSYSARGGVEAAVESARIRTEFVGTSLRMWATAPVFGVGSGRYYGISQRFMGPFIRNLGPENAHNNFLQIGAELGFVGFAGFVGILAAGGRRVRDALRDRADSPAPLLIGASTGVAAYLLTCLAGHPLLVHETAYPFWIASGLVAALAHGRSTPPTVPARRGAITGVTLICLFLAATLPLRVDAVVDDLAVRQDSRFGAFHWEIDPADGRCFRWTGPRATFFVPGDEHAVHLPLRASHASPDRPVTVDIAVGGYPLVRIPFFHTDWIRLPLRLPESGGRGGLHRVDLVVTPPWPPEERRNGDGRTLGVQVGTIERARECVAS